MNAAMSEAGAKPFIGLRPFGREDAPWFFGREELVAALLERLEERRFLAVIGASGSGKSSLVRAGLLPALDRGLLSGADGEWDHVEMRPGDEPLGNLAASLWAASPQMEESRALVPHVLALLRTGPLGGLEALRSLGLGAGGRPVLVLVDQLEEIFRYSAAAPTGEKASTKPGRMGGPGSSVVFATLARTMWRWFGFDDVIADLSAVQAEAAAADRAANEAVGNRVFCGPQREEAARLVGTLIALADQAEVPVYVVLTMRSDFIGHCDQFPGLSEAVSESQYLVPRLTRRQMEQAVRWPLMRVGATAEDRLVAEALNAAGNDPDALPLLQHALLRTWDKGCRRVARQGLARPAELRWNDYRCAGRFENALSRDAEAAYRRLDATQKRVAEVMFRSLCRQDSEGPLVRRVASVGEVANRAKCRPETVIEVIRAFRTDDRNFVLLQPASLLEDGEANALRAGLIDISHEALLRRWTRLRDWIREESRTIDFYRYLSDKAEDWRRQPRYTTLLRPPDLQRAVAWLKEYREVPEWADRHRPRTFHRVSFYIRFSNTWHVAFWAGVGLASLLLVGLMAWLGWGFYAQRNEARKLLLAKEAALQAAEASRAENQRLVIRNWAGVFGLGTGLPTVEANALWELAGLSATNETLRTNLWTAFGEDDDATRRLVGRFPLVFRAAVGLEPSRGREVFNSLGSTALRLDERLAARWVIEGAATVPPDAVEPWLRASREQPWEALPPAALSTNGVFGWAATNRQTEIAETLFGVWESKGGGPSFWRRWVEDYNQREMGLQFLRRVRPDRWRETVRSSLEGQESLARSSGISEFNKFARDLAGEPASEAVLDALVEVISQLTNRTPFQAVSDAMALVEYPTVPEADSRVYSNIRMSYRRLEGLGNTDMSLDLAEVTLASMSSLDANAADYFLDPRVVSLIRESYRRLERAGNMLPYMLPWKFAKGFRGLLRGMDAETADYFADHAIAAFRSGTNATKAQLVMPLVELGRLVPSATMRKIRGDLDAWAEAFPDAGRAVVAAHAAPNAGATRAETLRTLLLCPEKLARVLAEAWFETNQTPGLALFERKINHVPRSRTNSLDVVVEAGLRRWDRRETADSDPLLGLVAWLAADADPTLQDRLFPAIAERIVHSEKLERAWGRCILEFLGRCDVEVLNRHFPTAVKDHPARWKNFFLEGAEARNRKIELPAGIDYLHRGTVREANAGVLAEAVMTTLPRLEESERFGAVVVLGELARAASAEIAARVVDYLSSRDPADHIAADGVIDPVLASLFGRVDGERAQRIIERVLGPEDTPGDLANRWLPLLRSALEADPATATMLAERLTAPDALGQGVEDLANHEPLQQAWMDLAEKLGTPLGARMGGVLVSAWSDEFRHTEPPATPAEAYRQSRLEPTDAVIRAAALDPATADVVARVIVLRIPYRAPTSDADVARRRMHALLAAAGHVESVPVCRSLVAATLGGRVSGEVDPRDLRADGRMRRDASVALDRLSTADLVEVLKYPTSVGWAERALIDALQRRAAGAAFDGDYWKVSAWARQQPGLGIAAPPRRPILPRISEDGSWDLVGP